MFNTVSPNNNGALGNVKVRQALSEAINRTTSSRCCGGPKLNKPLTHVLPRSSSVVRRTSTSTPTTRQGQGRLLAAGRLPQRADPQDALPQLVRGQQQVLPDRAAGPVQDRRHRRGRPLAERGLLHEVPAGPSVARRGVWDLCLAGWGADWYGNAALSFFNPLFYGKPSFPPVGSNFGLYDSPTANASSTRRRRHKTPDEAASLWAQADKQVMEDAAFYPITNPKTANYRAAQVHNAVYMPAIQNFDPANVWLITDSRAAEQNGSCHHVPARSE